MSEAITKACDKCGGRGELSVFGAGATWEKSCGYCSGNGRVPDVEATLRAEVARLTEQNAYFKSERERLIPLAVQAKIYAPPPVFVLPPGVDGDTVALRVDNARLAAEVERLTEQRNALGNALSSLSDERGVWFDVCPSCGADLECDGSDPTCEDGQCSSHHCEPGCVLTKAMVELPRDVECMRARRVELAPATKPGEVECCAGCQYPRVCEGCAELRDAMDGRR